jgi:hypothetical protein
MKLNGSLLKIEYHQRQNKQGNMQINYFHPLDIEWGTKINKFFKLGCRL